MLGNWNVEYQNLNSQRRYPLTASSTAKDQSGLFEIPNSFILGLDLAVPTGIDVFSGKFFIKHIGAYATGYSIVVGYESDDGPVNAATALIARQTHARGQVYALGGMGDFSDAVGKVLIGPLDDIDLQPPGFFTFDFENARLEPDAIRPQIRGVTSITLVNGAQRSVPLYGDIEIQAGANVQLVPIIVMDQDPIIRINAIEGEGLIEACACEGTPTDPIRNISGIQPTPDGRFSLIAGECIELQPIANGLRIVDTCSKPCCSCPELEAVTRDLERLKSESEAVARFVDNLLAVNQNFNTTILGATLRDRACGT